MAMKLIKKTADYKIFMRGDERYAVQDANGKPINGEEKVNILVAEDLIKVTVPSPKEEAPAEAEDVGADDEVEVRSRRSGADEAASDDDTPAEPEPEPEPESEPEPAEPEPEQSQERMTKTSDRCLSGVDRKSRRKPAFLLSVLTCELSAVYSTSRHV